MTPGHSLTREEGEHAGDLQATQAQKLADQRYLQAIDPPFRDTMRLLEGNVLGMFSLKDVTEGISEEKNLLTEPTHLLTTHRGV